MWVVLPGGNSRWLTQLKSVESRPGPWPQAFDGEVLILHGEVDHLVPAEHAVRLHQAAVRAGQRLQRMGGE